MAILKVNLTRIESLNLKKSLKTATRGHKLLKDKLDELIKKLFELVNENDKLRKESEKLLQNAYKNFTIARAVMSEEYLQEALLVPKQTVTFNVIQDNIMSVRIPRFKFEENEEQDDNSQLYGFAFTSGDLDLAMQNFSEASNSLLKLAENEKSIELLATEVEKTRRRVNALENVMIPNYKDTIKYIQMKLDENERSNITRLMKVKDMVIEKK